MTSPTLAAARLKCASVQPPRDAASNVLWQCARARLSEKAGALRGATPPLRSFAKCRGAGHARVADAIVRASTSESAHGARAPGTW
jgi:hypothetical protein